MTGDDVFAPDHPVRVALSWPKGQRDRAQWNAAVAALAEQLHVWEAWLAQHTWIDSGPRIGYCSACPEGASSPCRYRSLALEARERWRDAQRPAEWTPNS